MLGTYLVKRLPVLRVWYHLRGNVFSFAVGELNELKFILQLFLQLSQTRFSSGQTKDQIELGEGMVQQ